MMALSIVLVRRLPLEKMSHMLLCLGNCRGKCPGMTVMNTGTNSTPFVKHLVYILGSTLDQSLRSLSAASCRKIWS